MQFTDTTTTAIFALCIATAPICILAVLLRFIAARSVGRKQTTEDWFAYAAVAVHLIYIGISLRSIASSHAIINRCY
jgi:hypothetical protein